MEMRPYTEVPSLAPYLLEESYVLGITATPARLVFVLDLALTPSHPMYRAPRIGEHLCYRRGELRFENVSRLLWADQGSPPATDASGELDYGQLDSCEWDAAGFRLEGSWGRIEVLAGAVAASVTETAG